MQDKSLLLRDKRLATSLGIGLVLAFRRINRATGRALRGTGLTPEQGHILLVLWLDGSMKIGQLQRALMLSSATLTGAIDRMERAGLVRRVPDPDDRRSWRLEPTGLDARARAKVETALEAMEADTFRALTAAERRELLRLLHKVALSAPGE